jgi:N-methylhydantoinase A
VIGLRPKFDLGLLAQSTPPTMAGRTTLDTDGSMAVDTPSSRRVYVNQAWREVKVVARGDLKLGVAIVGPALIEQADTTIWLEPGFAARLDARGNLLVNKVGQ